MGSGFRVTAVATWILLVGSLAAALAFVALRAALPSDGGRVAFYGDAWSSAGVRIEPIDPPAEGLQPGDVVASVAGRSLDAWIAAAPDPRVARPSGDGVPYVVRRDGAEVATQVTWGRPALGATLLEGWSVIVFSIGLAAVAAFVYARAPDVPAATALAIVTAAASGSSIPWFLGPTTSDLVVGWPYLLYVALTSVVYMLLWPAGLHLALVFPGRVGVVARHSRIIPAIYAATLGAYVVGIGLAGGRAASLLDWIGTWPGIQLAVIVPVVVVWAALIVVRFVRERDPGARTQMRLMTAGALTSTVLGLALFQGPELLTGRALVPSSAIGLIALPVPVGLGAAILRDRLFGIEVVVNRALVYGGMTLGVLVAYVGAVSAFTAMAGHDPGFGGSLLATGLAALVALPLRDALQRAVNRLIYGDRDEPWRAMRRLGQRLAWAADPDRAFPAIVETVADALRIPFVALELPGADAAPLVVARHGTPTAETLVVPLLHGAEPVGRLLLGPRAGEHGFRADERGLLEDLARQAGAAVRAISLREDLARSREALVVAREEERRRLRRDLHDGLGPALAAIGLHAEASADLVHSDPAGAERRLRELGDEVLAALDDIRRLVDGLRPPALDELGLVGAIRQQAERLETVGGDGAGPRIAVSGDGAGLAELPAAVEVAAYRIAVEALTNAVRHAGARSCRVRVEADDALLVEVVDDGRGIAGDARAGIGLESMRIRAAEVGGELIVERASAGGTRVVARLPVAQAASG